MNISLTPELENFIKQKVDCGLYTSASEVIRESLRLLHMYDGIHKQRMIEISHAIDEGMNQVKNQQTVDGKTSHKNMHAKVNAFSKGKR